MKHLISAGFLAVCLLLSQINLNAQTDAKPTGLPGDNFSLEGALALFSKATSLEDFEKALNTESNMVNNLDMNQDGNTDYIRVEDFPEGSNHAIILRALITEKETQDVAVIEIGKDGDRSASLQIIGNKELYGTEVILEPIDEKAFGGKGGPAHVSELVADGANVWFWPVVTSLYGPAYRPWVSPYNWGNKPTWWKPYKVRPVTAQYDLVRPYKGQCKASSKVKYDLTHNMYHSHQNISPIVQNFYRKAQEDYRVNHKPKGKPGKKDPKYAKKPLSVEGNQNGGEKTMPLEPTNGGGQNGKPANNGGKGPAPKPKTAPKKAPVKGDEKK